MELAEQGQRQAEKAVEEMALLLSEINQGRIPAAQTRSSSHLEAQTSQPVGYEEGLRAGLSAGGRSSLPADVVNSLLPRLELQAANQQLQAQVNALESDKQQHDLVINQLTTELSAMLLQVHLEYSLTPILTPHPRKVLT